MRRNTITLLRYLLAAVIVLIFGPYTLKQFFGNRDSVESFVKADLESLRGNKDVSVLLFFCLFIECTTDI